MQCQLCDTFHRAERAEERVKIGKDKEMVVINRLCSHRSAIVSAEDDGCEKFSPCRYFWCRGWDSWVTIAACQDRIKKDKYKSCPCSLGVEALGVQIQPKPVVNQQPPQQKKQLVVRRPKKMLVVRGKR